MISRRYKAVINRECTSDEASKLVTFMRTILGWKERVEYANFVGSQKTLPAKPTNEDVEVKCEDCGDLFLFTVGDQKFYADKDYTPPKRCAICRQARKESAQQNREQAHARH
jgi:hypothetical protein